MYKSNLGRLVRRLKLYLFPDRFLFDIAEKKLNRANDYLRRLDRVAFVTADSFRGLGSSLTKIKRVKYKNKRPKQWTPKFYSRG